MSSKLIDKIFDCEMNYTISQNSFSPLYSDFGLGLDGDFAGIRTLYLHYNRSTSSLFEPLLTLPGKLETYTPRADKVVYKTDESECEISFYDEDCVLTSCRTQCKISLFNSQTLNDFWIADMDESTLVLQGYSNNGDSRDPDKEVAVMVGVRALKGKLSCENDEISALPVDGEILLSFAFDVMNVDASEIKARLQNSPESVELAAEKTRAWVCETVKSLDVRLDDERQSTVFVKSIITLIFNLAKAPGNLEGYISSFPNRGGYPTHFMWDSCFQNLAYELMNIDLAKDSLLQLCNNIRPDGKIPQFLCSTWGRPHDAQPALLGWAAKRLYEKTNDIEFIKKIFPALESNNRWWLTQRITRYGVIKCADGLETGQDNSPRFDNGTVLAVDMNSYLLSQIKATAYFAEVLGFEARAAYWQSKADELNSAMLRYLYDEDKNMFFDADAKTAVKQNLLTTSGLIPLWAGVTVPESQAKAMVKDYLLNPKYFYADVPFPSVAYTESVYDPADWWRGPTWMPEAWIMLEVLKIYGFESEYIESAQKIYNILLRDAVLHELFNSQTGEGMGNLEQGWTAAIFIKIHTMLN